jgi:hypothetical protein
MTDSSSPSSLLTFIKKIPLSVFICVLLFHFVVLWWMLSARLDIPQRDPYDPIIVTLEITDPEQVPDLTSAQSDTAQVPDVISSQSGPAHISDSIPEKSDSSLRSE